MPRKFGGRRRVVMERITNQRRVSVTFAKRYSGIFIKVRDLCTLCGVKLAILLLSPTLKPYSLGVPNVDAVVNLFLGQNHVLPCSTTSHHKEFLREIKIKELNTHLTNILGHLECLKKAEKELNKKRDESQENGWWGAPIENLGIEELEQLKVAMLELKVPGSILSARTPHGLIL
uniref:agamous-like MADS-box protein AGL62 n=1 Tax=Erigeron canadensis TaxID=72917 RepID=UPI001CB955E7|nr:agamous-like MADS-box protein AGL62 [Erigeron canadensis]